jgi:hypothetical protein
MRPAGTESEDPGASFSHVTHGRGRAMLSKPLAYPSTLDRRPPAARVTAVAVLRGGALEPGPR